MDKREKIWVSSNTGKAVGLIDRDTVVELPGGKKDFQRVEISNEMAEQDVPVLVVKSSFIQGMYSDPMNVLRMWVDVDAAKKKHDDYMKKHDANKKEKVDEKKATEKAKKDAIAAAMDTFDKSFEKTMQIGKQPKVIRNKPGEKKH